MCFDCEDNDQLKEKEQENHRRQREQRSRFERARTVMEDELPGCYARRWKVQKAVERTKKSQVRQHGGGKKTSCVQ